MVYSLLHRDNDLSALVASAPSQHPHPGEYMDEGKNNSSLNNFSTNNSWSHYQSATPFIRLCRLSANILKYSLSGLAINRTYLADLPPLLSYPRGFSVAVYTVQGEETERSSVLQLNSPRLELEDNKEAVRIPSLNTLEDNTEAVKIPGLNTLEDSPITSSRTKHLDDAIADLRCQS